MTQLPVDLIKSRRRCCHLQLAFLFQFHRTNLFGALHCIATSTQRQTAAKWTSNNLHGTADHGIEALQHRAAGNKLPVYSHTVCVPNSKSQAKSRNGYVLFSKYSHTRGRGNGFSELCFIHSSENPLPLPPGVIRHWLWQIIMHETTNSCTVLGDKCNMLMEIGSEGWTPTQQPPEFWVLSLPSLTTTRLLL
jgi:hypothetical protein